MAKDGSYHVARDGAIIGEYRTEDLRRLVAEGKLHGTDLAWCEGMADWAPVSQMVAARPQAVHPLPPRPPGVRQPGSLATVPSGTAVVNPYAVTSKAPVGKRGPADDGDPLPGTPHFGRLAYVGSYFAGLVIVVGAVMIFGSRGGGISILAILLLGFGMVMTTHMRVRDAGHSGWMALLMFVPIANLYIQFVCLAAPRGWVVTRQGDTAMTVVCWILAAVFVLGLAGSFV